MPLHLPRVEFAHNLIEIVIFEVVSEVALHTFIFIGWGYSDALLHNSVEFTLNISSGLFKVWVTEFVITRCSHETWKWFFNYRSHFHWGAALDRGLLGRGLALSRLVHWGPIVHHSEDQLLVSVASNRFAYEWCNVVRFILWRYELLLLARRCLLLFRGWGQLREVLCIHL
jgi:hypothetical protein